MYLINLGMNVELCFKILSLELGKCVANQESLEVVTGGGSVGPMMCMVPLCGRPSTKVLYVYMRIGASVLAIYPRL